MSPAAIPKFRDSKNDQQRELAMRVLCIGSAMIDIIVIVASRNIERMTMSNVTASYLLLEQGTKVEAESISTHVGGGAVNSAVAMRRLGAEVAVLSKVGDDTNGRRVMEHLAAEGVDAGFVACGEGLPTGQAVMVSSHDRNAAIFVQRGANGHLGLQDIRPEMFDGRDLVYVSTLSNQSAESFPAIVEYGRKANAFVTVNPGIRQITARTEALLSSLAGVELIAVNRLEASALVPAVAVRGNRDSARELAGISEATDAPPLLHAFLTFGGFEMAFPELVSRLMELTGVRRVLVTDGRAGACLADDSGVHFCPHLDIEPQGTAGAGDAFTSTLSRFLAAGCPAGEALQAAAVNAASVVEWSDTQSGLLTSEALKARTDAVAARLPIRSWAWAS